MLNSGGGCVNINQVIPKLKPNAKYFGLGFG